MEIIKGKYSGFCFGVKRAVEAAMKLDGKRNFILGEIIHNEYVNRKLRDMGIVTVNDLDEAQFRPGDNLLIRTHGEPESTFIKAEKLGLNVIDCTCPFVKDIQKIVRKHYNDGYKIAIIGNKDHPEIKGINGWCGNSAIITEDGEELKSITAEKLCIVVQTTFSETKFELIIKNFVANAVKTVDIFKTICYTTTRRQKEAEFLSSSCDAMMVIGGAASNNTERLFDICKKNCENVFRIVDIGGFDFEKIKCFNKIGVVMGASTPIEQFREVISNMENTTSEEIKITEAAEQETVQPAVTEETAIDNAMVAETVADDAAATAAAADNSEKAEAAENSEKRDANPAGLAEQMEKAFNDIKPDKDLKLNQIVSVRISSADDNGITVTLNNSKKDITIEKDQLLGDYAKENYQSKIGEKIRVMVVGKAPIKFSEKAMENVLKEEADIDEIRNGRIFEAEITDTNKGGLTGKYGKYEVFVPASQIKLGFVKDLTKYVGKKLRLKAEKVESRGARKQIVGSQRVILAAEKEERDALRAQKEAEFFDSIQEGDVVLGTPVRFASFGAFIDVNGFDCLAHISDLSWTSCNDCSEVLELGKQYEFKILKINTEAKRVSVGYKQLQPKPWDSVLERYSVGDVIKGKVVRLVSFGAFVEVEKGIDGLVHISQISNQWLENPVSALQVGQEVEAKILDINPEREKMTLSIKALMPEAERPARDDDKKGKKRVKNDDEDIGDLREWKDNENGGASIADILGNNNK